MKLKSIKVIRAKSREKLNEIRVKLERTENDTSLMMFLRIIRGSVSGRAIRVDSSFSNREVSLADLWHTFIIAHISASEA